MSDNWVPFGMDDDAAEEYHVLQHGVPKHLREPLLGWLKPALETSTWVHVERSQALEMLTGLPLGVQADAWVKYGRYVEGQLRHMPAAALLRVVDAVLSLDWYGSRQNDLEQILARGRSKWTVGERMAGKAGLVTRVPEGVQDMVEATIATSGTAGQLLARAWGKVHGFTPDDPGAYFDAVKAVERVAKPLVEPNNDEATLGSITGILHNDGDWRLPLREHKHAPTAVTIVAMCRALWRGHLDRHATADDYRDVTHEEAMAGVALAATLVYWFSEGLIQRRSP